MRYLFIIIATLVASLPTTAVAQHTTQSAPERQNWQLHTLYGRVESVTERIYRQNSANPTTQDSLCSWHEWRFNEQGDVALYASGNNKREILTQEIYTYNTQGLTQSVDCYTTETSHLYSTLYSYNDKGQLLQSATYRNDTLLSREIYSYTEQGYLAEKQRYLTADELDSQHTFLYNERGDEIEERSIDKWGERVESNEIEYDREGRIIRKALYLSSHSPISEQQYSYDQAGNLTQIIYYDYDGSLWRQTLRSYDSQNRLCEQRHYNAKGKMTNKELLFYDEQGNIIRKAFLRGTQPKPYSQIEYEIVYRK